MHKRALQTLKAGHNRYETRPCSQRARGALSPLLLLADDARFLDQRRHRCVSGLGRLLLLLPFLLLRCLLLPFLLPLLLLLLRFQLRLQPALLHQQLQIQRASTRFFESRSKQHATRRKRSNRSPTITQPLAQHTLLS